MLINTLICALTFGILDAIWFAVFMKSFAIRAIGSHLSMKDGALDVNMFNTLTAYVLMVAVAVLFLGNRVAESGCYLESIGWGFAMGICVFGVFDFTNGAMMKNYPIEFVLIDTLWGGFIYAVAAVVMKRFAQIA